LKSSRPEPDVETAVRIGVDQLLQTDESVVTSGYEWTYNYVPVDILQRLVGPTSFRNLTRHVKNLQDLCRLEETDLAALLNNKEKARSLYRFLHQVF
jgi:ERCC4-type nuclease